MGVVYEAVQTSLQRRVALKVLRPELAEDPAFVARFGREARLQASIEHPHVLDVYEVGEIAPGELFLSMRLVEGSSLADLIRSGELDAERALRLMEQAAGALDAAHEAGLLHRDVKPQNILVGDDGTAFLADFGLSRARSDSLTSSRPTVGTVAYVAPEVVRGEEPGPAADRYAFAATLFHCLTGDVVFPRGSDAAVLFAHAGEPPPRISARRSALPATLDDVFARGLAKDPAQRPATAEAMVAAVRAALGDAVAELGPPDLTGAGGGDLETVGTPVVAAPERGHRVGVPVLVAATLAAALIGAGAVALLDDDDEDERGAPAPAPAVAKGAVGLGSELLAVDRSVDCRRDGKARPSCAILQSALPGRRLLVPRDGRIKRWAVAGARGELALEVIRLRGDETVRVNRSRWESAGNTAPHVFTTDLAVERGDALGVVLGRGARIGAREAKGATTIRWTDPADGFYGKPDRELGAGRDLELALRADLVAGATLAPPEALTGAAAANAPAGTVRERESVEISKPPARVTLALVEVGDRVALDLRDRGGRVARTFIPGLRPKGQPIDLRLTSFEGEDSAGAEVWWVNPNSGRMDFRFFFATARGLDYFG